MDPISHLRRFAQDEEGTTTVEFLLVFPLLAWILLFSLTAFRGFEARSDAVKGTYTIADMLSREVNAPVTPALMDGMQALLGRLVPSDTVQMLRVTVFRYRASDDRYLLVWSQIRGTGAVRTETELANIRNIVLPVMYDGEIGILVETRVLFTPPFTVGVGSAALRNTMVIRPRFAPTLCWSTVNTGPWSAANQTC